MTISEIVTELRLLTDAQREAIVDALAEVKRPYSDDPLARALAERVRRYRR